MTFGFVTCVQLGLSCMEEIYRVGGRLDLAITLRDDQARAKSGRVYLDAFCRDHGVPLVKSGNVNDQAVVDAVRDAEVDWLFIVGWSQIARREVLDAPQRGCLGMHPTLLPVGRGRAAIPWAILKGLDETGVTLFKLDEGVDTGPVLAQETIPLGPRETATGLYDKVVEAHQTLIARAWPALDADEVLLQTQDDAAATVWPGRQPEDGKIDSAATVGEVDRLVRAVTKPYPGAFMDIGGRRLRVWAGKAGPPSGDGPVLSLCDGPYSPTEWEWEPSPPDAQPVQ